MSQAEKRIFKILGALVSVAFWVVVWAIVAKQIDSEFLLPSPKATTSALFTLVADISFWQTVGASLIRILIAILLSLVIGSGVAAFTANIKPMDTLLSPLMTVIKATPVASFIVLAILWVDRDTLPAFITMLIVIPIVWSNVSAGITGVDKKLLEVAKIYNFSFGKKIYRIYLPSVMPYFLAACRASLGMAWKAGIAAEVLCTPKEAIGTEIYLSKMYMETTDLFAWTLTVIILSVVIEKLLISGIRSLSSKLHLSDMEVK